MDCNCELRIADSLFWIWHKYQCNGIMQLFSGIDGGGARGQKSDKGVKTEDQELLTCWDYL